MFRHIVPLGLAMLALIGTASAQSDLPEYLQPIHGVKTLSSGFSADGPLRLEIPHDGEEPLEDRLDGYDGDTWKCNGDTTIPPALILSVGEGIDRLYLKAMEEYAFVGDFTFGVVRPDGTVLCDEGGNQHEPLLLDLEPPLPGDYFIWIGHRMFSSEDTGVSLLVSEAPFE